jgi:hypothetical protein
VEFQNRLKKDASYAPGLAPILKYMAAWKGWHGCWPI